MSKALNKWLYEKTRNLLRWNAKVVRKNIEVEGHNIAYLESKNSSKKPSYSYMGLTMKKKHGLCWHLHLTTGIISLS